MENPRRYSLGIELIAWAVIIAVVALNLSLHYSSRWRGLRKPTQIAAPSTDLIYLGRYALGAKVIFPSIQSQKSWPAIEGQLEHAAHGPADQLRVIAIEAELGMLSDPQSSLQTLLTRHPNEVLAADIRSAQMVYRQGPEHLSPQQRAELIEHHEWFGRLMLAWGHSPDDPVRQDVEAAAQRTFIGVLTVGCLGLLMAVVGFVLLVLAIVFFVNGRLDLAYVPPPFASTQFIEAVAVYMVCFIAGSIALAFLFRGKNPGLSVNWLLLPVVVFAVYWPRLRGVGKAEWRYAFGYHAGKGVWREMGAGVVGYLAMLPVLALAMFMTTLLMRHFPRENPTHPIMQEFGKGPWVLLQVYLLACVWAPITEEAMFRGALFHHLRGWLGFWPTALIVSFVFAIIHPQGFLGLPSLMVIALFLALLRQWRSSLIASMTAHALSNFLVTTMAAMMLG